MCSNSVHSSDLLSIETKDATTLNPLKSINLKLTRDQKQKPAIVKPTQSSVLSRVQAFLPQLKQANDVLEERLQSESAGSVDIENVGPDERYIEMNLALVARDCSDDESSDSVDSDSDSEEPCLGEVTECNIKLPSDTAKRPVIEELEDGVP